MMHKECRNRRTEKKRGSVGEGHIVGGMVTENYGKRSFIISNSFYTLVHDDTNDESVRIV